MFRLGKLLTPARSQVRESIEESCPETPLPHSHSRLVGLSARAPLLAFRAFDLTEKPTVELRAKSPRTSGGSGVCFLQQWRLELGSVVTTLHTNFVTCSEIWDIASIISSSEGRCCDRWFNGRRFHETPNRKVGVGNPNRSSEFRSVAPRHICRLCRVVSKRPRLQGRKRVLLGHSRDQSAEESGLEAGIGLS